MTRPKVFCLGFQKTGTSSIREALTFLGYRVGGYASFREYHDRSDLTLAELRERVLEVADEFDAFQDSPWPIFYKELDAKYPNSKFILVIRRTEDWIRSAVDDFGDYDSVIRQLIYGVGHPKGHEEIWIERYKRHNREVQEYFQNRPQDLLVLNLNQGEVTWQNVCGFLGHEVPDIPWPHVNTKQSKKRLMFKQRLLNRLNLSNWFKG
jgi:hypothetical protein